MNKEKIIQKINSIIDEYGTFSDGELEKDSSICHNSMGNMVSLIEYFNKDYAEVEIYDTASSGSNSISSYNVNYKDLSLDTLNEILKFTKQYEKLQSENL